MEPNSQHGVSELLVNGQPFYGQHQARKLLGRAVAADRLAHAYLFCGQEGIGKKLLATALAAALSCGQAKGLSACGVCPSCKKIAAATHPDFHVVSPEKGAIKIDQIRTLIKQLTFPPYEAECRVVVVEDIHRMRREAANALLKTLEEPPANNILILTAESASQVLATILSRCQVVPFYGLTPSETAKILSRTGSGLDQDAALLLARLAEGSPGRAQLLMKRELVAFWQELNLLLFEEQEDQVAELARILKMAEAMAALEEDLGQIFSFIRLWIRDGLFALHGQQVLDASLKTRKDWNFEQYFAKLGAVNQAERELARNCNRIPVCEVLLFRLKG